MNLSELQELADKHMLTLEGIWVSPTSRVVYIIVSCHPSGDLLSEFQSEVTSRTPIGETYKVVC